MFSKLSSFLISFFKPIEFIKKHSNNINKIILYFLNYLICVSLVFYNHIHNLRDLEIPFGLAKDSFLYSYYVDTTWQSFIVYICLWGLVTYFIFWFLVTWWFKKNLHWSGVKDIKSKEIRPVLILSFTYFSLPLLIALAFYILLFSDPIEATKNLNILKSIFIIFSLVEACIFFVAIKSLYKDLNKWGWFWFVFLPVVSASLELTSSIR
ncbi:hypothetical protein [Halobacteriovorax sp. DPLXC-1]|uniref:hypothetical protein n=1 Tax=Halobacteriovorax sp. DPLXC-1 TaxID=3110771 RepID=UPI002FF07C3E